jgi:cytochrome c-type biogenesis protein CcmH/NrfF
MEFIKDLARFLSSKKKLWMLPLILIVVIFGLIIVIAESSVLSPFIYALF